VLLFVAHANKREEEVRRPHGCCLPAPGRVSLDEIAPHLAAAGRARYGTPSRAPVLRPLLIPSSQQTARCGALCGRSAAVAATRCVRRRQQATSSPRPSMPRRRVASSSTCATRRWQSSTPSCASVCRLSLQTTMLWCWPRLLAAQQCVGRV